MPKYSFHVESGYLLVGGGHRLDLHNSYSLVGVEVSNVEAQVTLRWQRDTGAWVNPHDPISLTLVFTDVCLLRVTTPVTWTPADSATLAFAGYLSAEDLEVMDGYLELPEVVVPSHIIFGFQGGLAVKIGANSSHFSVEEEG